MRDSGCSLSPPFPSNLIVEIGQGNMKSHGIKYVVEINNALAMDKLLGDGRGILGDW